MHTPAEKLEALIVHWQQPRGSSFKAGAWFHPQPQGERDHSIRKSSAAVCRLDFAQDAGMFRVHLWQVRHK